MVTLRTCLVAVLAVSLSPHASVARPCHTQALALVLLSSTLMANTIDEHFINGYTWDIDPRLPIAIAGAESSFGTNGTCATDRNNAWGFCGGPPACCTFSSFADGVDDVIRTLRTGYLDLGRVTIPQIGALWCGSGCEHWVTNVSFFYRKAAGDFGNLTYGGGCCGDCNGNVNVSIDELIYLVNIAIKTVDPGHLPLAGYCPRGDYDADGLILIHDLVADVGAALSGCSAP